jgi:hypothetical protein
MLDGYVVKDHNDPHIKSSSRVMKEFSEAAAPGRWLVDLIPICTSDTSMSATFLSSMNSSKTHTRLVSRRKFQAIRSPLSRQCSPGV